MRYDQIRLVDAAPHFEAIAEIVTAVRETKTFPPIDALAALQSFARRGDTAALAWEGDRIVGCVCLGACTRNHSGLMCLTHPAMVSRVSFQTVPRLPENYLASGA